MNITFTWRNMPKSEAMEELLEDKLDKLERHDDHVTEIHVILEMHNKHEYSVKATAHLPGADINAHAKEDDMYKAIDHMTHSLIRQVETRKEKMKDHRDHRDRRANEDDQDDEF